MFQLRADTKEQWAQYVADNMNAFLSDHASCERKASASAMHFVVRYPDKVKMVRKMIEIAIEELEHFQQVFEIMRERGLSFVPDEPDPYVNGLLKAAISGGPERLLDRLLIGSIVEFRGCERFAMLGRQLKARGEEELGRYYIELAAAESQHRLDFYRCAELYFEDARIQERLDLLLDVEASLVESLPIRAALH